MLDLKTETYHLLANYNDVTTQSYRGSFVVVVVVSFVIVVVVVAVNLFLRPCLLLLTIFYLVVVNECQSVDFVVDVVVVVVVIIVVFRVVNDVFMALLVVTGQIIFSYGQ